MSGQSIFAQPLPDKPTRKSALGCAEEHGHYLVLVTGNRPDVDAGEEREIVAQSTMCGLAAAEKHTVRAGPIPVAAVLMMSARCMSTPETFDFPDWRSVGYQGFVDSIDVVAGSDAVNCGFFNLIIGDGRMEKPRGIQCAMQAYANGVPFKFGTVRIPTDSYAYEILLRSMDGEHWRIVYDVMIDGTVPQIRFWKCGSIEFARNLRSYEVHDCTPYDGSEDPNWNGS